MARAPAQTAARVCEYMSTSAGRVEVWIGRRRGRWEERSGDGSFLTAYDACVPGVPLLDGVHVGVVTTEHLQRRGDVLIVAPPHRAQP